MRNIVHSCARYAELARKGLFPCRMGRGSGEINTIIINIAKNIENSVSGMVVRTPTGLSHIVLCTKQHNGEHGCAVCACRNSHP